jgi:hypothetical protein
VASVAVCRHLAGSRAAYDATVRRHRALVLIVAGVAALVLAGAAQAARKATPAERQEIAAATLPSGNGYYRGGRVAWAEVSTAGPYAVAWVAARPHVHGFQDALYLLKGRSRHWRVAAVIYDTGCPGVPRKVLLDLRHFFAAREPKFLAPGEPGYHGCAAKIAYAK